MKLVKYVVWVWVVVILCTAHSYAQTCGTCNWYGSNYPACCNQSTGWGWENNQSCISGSTCTASGQSLTTNSSSSSSSGSCNGYSYCPNGSGDDGDGDGWGWSSSASCIVAGSSADSCGGSSSSSSSSSSGGSCPSSISCPSGMSCGCYTVRGLGANKQAYKNAGADRRFLASAMMETELMDTNYTYGDGKSGDAFNAGACKQNWGMARVCHSAWNGLSSGNYSTMAAMNSSRSLDVQVYNECRSYFGNNWFAGHRNGSSGLSNPNTTDINNFKAGYDWTYNMLSGHETDDVRFWVSIPPI